MQKITTRVDELTYKRLVKKAKANGQSIQYLINEAIRQYLRRLRGAA